jgi:hypothetical protein
VSEPLDNPAFDLDEDLFDFPQVVPDSGRPEEGSDEDLAEVLASFRAASLEEADGPDEHGSVSHEPRGPVDPADPLDQPGILPLPDLPAGATPRPVTRPRTGSTPRPDSAATALPAPRPPLARGLVAIALGVTLLNSLVALVFLTRAPGPGEEVRAVDSAPPARFLEPPANDPVRDATPALPDPDLARRVHGHPVLDEAREELARGDYAASRQHAYTLLSVVDRFEDLRREEIEAECQFLIAQALHLEALARLGRDE